MNTSPMPNTPPPTPPPGQPHVDDELPIRAGEVNEDAAPAQADPRPQGELEREVAQWASANRNAFANRRDFNLALCDRLAARGIPPLAGVLRRLGGKGTSTSQSEDVQQWFTALAARLNTLEAQIPLGARRQANTLIEQLWLAARHEVDERVAAPLRAELASAQEAIDKTVNRVRELEAALVAEGQRAAGLSEELQSTRTQAQAAAAGVAGELQAARAALEEAKREHAQAVDRLNAEVAQVRDQAAAEIRQLG